MRITSGKKRGLRLEAIHEDWIRPTSDKVRQAVFNSLQTELDDETVFLDLYAGSGAMGIEALSRGAQHAYFVDQHPKSIALIQKNIRKAGFEENATVIRSTAQKALDLLSKKGIRVDIVYLDPPYADSAQLEADAFKMIEQEILKKNGIMVLEYKKNDIISINIKELNLFREKTYGLAKVEMYRLGSSHD
ncbi:MAG: 16S rRNA (guanine(966)-N(2))-methyltransferase RsmD [Eubacteriaceae bacterium]|jgi:16S rRNA (guanine(966)-N(2))-methyltransferase RsmD|nr:16S rRNA (guanine(966)-N(2))-methyltransferase RsmD [Eubacteriaceae bacterium]